MWKETCVLSAFFKGRGSQSRTASVHLATIYVKKWIQNCKHKTGSAFFKADAPLPHQQHSGPVYCATDKTKHHTQRKAKQLQSTPKVKWPFRTRRGRSRPVAEFMPCCKSIGSVCKARTICQIKITFHADPDCLDPSRSSSTRYCQANWLPRCEIRDASATTDSGQRAWARCRTPPRSE